MWFILRSGDDIYVSSGALLFRFRFLLVFFSQFISIKVLCYKNGTTTFFHNLQIRYVHRQIDAM
jgi:hypothetical protein